MTDLSLRLPNSRLRAVLNLGPKRAGTISLPHRFADPELSADWEEDDEVSALFVAYEDGQLHLEKRGDTLDLHFHDASGEESERSPWPSVETAVLTEWATLLIVDLHALFPSLLDDITDAAAWHDAGFDLYVCEVEEPVQLDLLEIEVEGELLTLPWLGAGSVSHDHIEGDDHPIALYWNLGTPDADVAIAEARLPSGLEEPVTRAIAGVDWSAVGLPEDEVLDWLKGVYLNHHVIPVAEGVLFDAVLRRLAGLDPA